MGMFGEIARKNFGEYLVKKIEEKIKIHKRSPKTVKVLKEIGREVLSQVDSYPKWFKEYQELFKESPTTKKEV